MMFYRSFKFDNKGWDIDFKQLVAPEKNTCPDHYVRDDLFESADKKYACLFYEVIEYRMGFEAGVIAVFQNKQRPTLIINPYNQWFQFQGDRTLVFCDNFLFARKHAYNEDENLSGTPFVVFDLANKMFGFIDFDVTSIYYLPVKIDDTIFEFNLDTPNEIKRMKVINRHRERFDVTSLIFHPFDKVNDLLELYFQQKKNAC